jgi:hypothetical protein
MNRQAKSIVKGWIVSGLLVGSLTALFPAPAKAATVIPSKWGELCKYAIEQSIRSYGRSTYDHFCEPDLKVCTSFVYYPVGYEKIFLREVSDNNDRIIVRDVCTINENGDSRRCKNFDTNTTRLDVVSGNGRWVTVEGSIF